MPEFRVFQTWPHRDRLLIEARWESQEYLVRYLQSRIYKRLLLLAELGSAPPGVEFLPLWNFVVWILSKTLALQKSCSASQVPATQVEVLK